MNNKLPDFLKNYPGNKEMQGIAEKIINQIPPHQFYIERFAGSAVIFRKKKPAQWNFLYDVDKKVISALMGMGFKNTTVEEKSVIDFWHPNEACPTFVFDDPPYPIESRLSQSKMYHHEMTLEDHERYLRLIAIPATYNLMICSNPNPLYERYLFDWRKIEVEVNYHGQPAIEVIYMNYPEPVELHDYRFLGSDCWERQRIHRKINRHVSRLNALPPLERNAIVEQIKNNF